MDNKQNRVIRFRAWDTNKKTMLYERDHTGVDEDGDEHDFVERIIQIDEERFMFFMSRCVYSENCNFNDGDVIRGPLMQFIGLKDKKGKDIYEGDIVRFEVENEDMWSGDNQGVIQYEKYRPMFNIQTQNSGDITIGCGYDAYSGTLEVIGNVHENGDLLDK